MRQIVVLILTEILYCRLAICCRQELWFFFSSQRLWITALTLDVWPQLSYASASHKLTCVFLYHQEENDSKQLFYSSSQHTIFEDPNAVVIKDKLWSLCSDNYCQLVYVQWSWLDASDSNNTQAMHVPPNLDSVLRPEYLQQGEAAKQDALQIRNLTVSYTSNAYPFWQTKNLGM